MICSKCGCNNDPVNKICNNCGNVLNSVDNNTTIQNNIDVLNIEENNTTVSNNSVNPTVTSSQLNNTISTPEMTSQVNNSVGTTEMANQANNTVSTPEVTISVNNSLGTPVMTNQVNSTVSTLEMNSSVNNSINTPIITNQSNNPVSSPEMVSPATNPVSTPEPMTTFSNNVNAGKNSQVDNKLKKLLNNKKMIILICSVVAVIGIIAGIIIFIGNNKNTNKSEINNFSSNSFFLENSKGLDAIFDIDGNQITDFEFEHSTRFINNSAVVYKNEKYGLISESGKMIIDYGKYDFLSNEGSVILARKKDDSEVVLNHQGKEIYKLEDDEIKLEAYLTQEHLAFIIDNKKNQIIILDYKGDEIKKIKSSSGEVQLIDSLDLGKFKCVYIEGKTYFIDENKGEILFTLDGKYKFEEFSDDESKFVFTDHTNIDEDDDDYVYDSNYKYKNVLVENGKIVNENRCEGYSIFGNEIICSNGEEHHLYKDKKIYFNVYKTSYEDTKNYVTYESDVGSSFYKDGKLVKTDKCLILKSFLNNNYGLHMFSNKCVDGNLRYAFYNSNGENVFNKFYKDISSFDDNGYASVTEDGINKYLIDKKGNKVSKEYDTIREESEYYIVEKDDLYGILDKNLNEIISVENSRIDISFEKYAELTKEDGSTVLYDLKNKKELFKLTEEVSITYYPEYMEVYTYDDNVRNRYFSYTTGKMFYDGK